MQNKKRRLTPAPFYVVLLLILPLFFSSCISGGGKFLSSPAQLGAFFTDEGLYRNISGDIEIKISSMGKTVHAKGYWYSEADRLRLLLLNPLSTPQLDLLLTGEASYLLDYEKHTSYNLSEPSCSDLFPLQEELFSVLPLLSFRTLKKENGRIVSAVLGKEGDIRELRFLFKKDDGNLYEGKISYSDYKEEGKYRLPHRFEVSVQGVDILFTYTDNIKIDKGVDAEIFSPSYFRGFTEGCL